ncbi:MAG TPA: lysylphosphatidylglycerol synthase transmembrane domain-containing protein [Acidimicrobiales bacterium]|nr:lysylphosphatidylglycerol synthase transmembrane domain-containing protein [Acidimicrobiales bacterium]
MHRAAVLLRRPWVRRSGALVMAVLGIVFLVVPQFRSASHHLGLLSQVHPGLLTVGVLLEGASFLAYGLFTRAVLPPEGRPPWHWLVRVDMVGSGLTHVLPGGGTTASAVRFQMLRKGGVRGTDAAFGSVLQGLGSAIVVNFLLLVGVLVVLPTRGGNPLYAVGAGVGAVLVTLFVLLCLTFTKGEEHAVRLVRHIGARLDRGPALERLARQIAYRLQEVMADPPLMARAAGWAAANWLLDAGSLWVFLLAFGHRVDLGSILVAFGLANTLAVLPVTPGGLGIVEGVLIPSLVGFGTPQGIAILGVLAWRLFNFWAPIPAGALSWASIQLGLRRRRPAVSTA